MWGPSIGQMDDTDTPLGAATRIEALEALLAQSREREEALTSQSFKDQATIVRFGTKNAELASLAAGAAAAEVARREAEGAAADAERRLTIAKAELETRLAEIEQLRGRCAELRSDMESLAGEAAVAAVARAETERLTRERDQARERALAERRLAADDRARADEAERLVALLQGRLNAGGSPNGLSEGSAIGAPKRQVLPRVPRPVAATPPWIELQRANSDSAAPSATVLPWPPKDGDEVIDLSDD
jgi:hypothetical protein